MRLWGGSKECKTDLRAFDALPCRHIIVGNVANIISDVGLLHIDPAIVDKEGRYSQDEWKMMLTAKKAMPDKPDGSFVGYVKWYVTKHGTAR